jgi:hypothetical protein
MAPAYRKGIGMKNKIEVGQTVYLYREQQPKPTKVVSVGKKYFQIDDPWFRRTQFFIDTLLSNTECGSPDQIYLDKQELLDEIEMNKLKSELIQSCRYFDNFNLDQLRRIKSIIEEKKG